MPREIPGLPANLTPDHQRVLDALPSSGERITCVTLQDHLGMRDTEVHYFVDQLGHMKLAEVSYDDDHEPIDARLTPQGRSRQIEPHRR